MTPMQLSSDGLFFLIDQLQYYVHIRSFCIGFVAN